MANVVGVLLFKFFVVDVVLLSELALPEAKGLVKVEADALEEKTDLKAPVMLQMMLVLQGSVQRLHAGGHVSARIVVQVCKADFVLTRWCFRLKQVKVDGVVIRETHEHAVDALVFHDQGEELARFE